MKDIRKTLKRKIQAGEPAAKAPKLPSPSSCPAVLPGQDLRAWRALCLWGLLWSLSERGSSPLLCAFWWDWRIPEKGGASDCPPSTGESTHPLLPGLHPSVFCLSEQSKITSRGAAPASAASFPLWITSAPGHWRSGIVLLDLRGGSLLLDSGGRIYVDNPVML